jgi:hypothetical protein
MDARRRAGHLTTRQSGFFDDDTILERGKRSNRHAPVEGPDSNALRDQKRISTPVVGR